MHRFNCCGISLRPFLVIATLVLIGVVGVRDPARAGPPKRVAKMMYLDNGVVRIGIDLNQGGSIGYFADSKNGQSVINIHDLGRWVGQSYYSGPKPFGNAHKAWKDWPLNPVCAGDVYGRWSEVMESNNDGQTLYVRTIPKQWALNNVAADCVFETWIRLEGSSAMIRNRLTNQRGDWQQYEAMDQELPAAYAVGTLHKLMTYVGDRPFTGEPLMEIPKKPAIDNKAQWSTMFATEHWAALVNDQDWGLGVIHPGAVRFIGGFYGEPGRGGRTDDPTGYIAPVRQEILDHNIVYEYSYTLVLGNLNDIRQRARELRPAKASPQYRFTEDRQHFWLLNTTDKGWPVTKHLEVRLKGDDPQLIGPEDFWLAADVPVIAIRAAFRTKLNSAQLFWERADRPGFPEEQSMRVPIQPDGKTHTYRISLAESPEYRGVIRRLRFDPVNHGVDGEWVKVESITRAPD